MDKNRKFSKISSGLVLFVIFALANQGILNAADCRVVRINTTVT